MQEADSCFSRLCPSPSNVDRLFDNLRLGCLLVFAMEGGEASWGVLTRRFAGRNVALVGQLADRTGTIQRAHLCQPKVTQHASARFVVKQEVCGLDVPVDNSSLVDVFQSLEERFHVDLDMAGVHVFVKGLLVSFFMSTGRGHVPGNHRSDDTARR